MDDARNDLRIRRPLSLATRRQVLGGLAACAAPAVLGAGCSRTGPDSSAATPMGSGSGRPAETGYDQANLPLGVRARVIAGVNGLAVHALEAGFDRKDRPCVLLLHGFPELAYSWRKVMLPLAQAGFHVIAPDQRGYGRTTGWDGAYEGDLGSFRMFNLVHDAMSLVFALGYRSVAAVIGHDFGSPVAAWCSLIRPDVFRSVVLMSAPFAGPPAMAFDTINQPAQAAPAGADIDQQLAALKPPRKHYQWYYSTRRADADMLGCRQGVHAFLRAYYHCKSTDWSGNRPFRLKSWTAEELAKMPTYYIMERDKDMAETVAPFMPSAAEVAGCKWLSDEELGVYSGEFTRTGFQGGLQWYRCATSPRISAEMEVFSGRTIDVPSCFIAGRSDWGTYQRPGAFESMQKSACTKMLGCHLVEGAGHWVQQEQPEQTSKLLVAFLGKAHG